MESDGSREGQIAAPTQLPLREDELDRDLKQCMKSLQELIDSPQTQFILRNVALTLLELPDRQFDVEKAYVLLTSGDARDEAVRKLREATPEIWGESWNLLRSKDTDPLYSIPQQQSLTRLNLIRFWVNEWEKIPEPTRAHVASLLGNLR